jgi:hypothetical protein
MPTMLSKSRVLSGKQCPKRLWLEVNEAELRVSTPDAQRRFRQGNLLNDVVHRLQPDGVLIGPEVALADALQITRRHLANTPQRPLFEATFSSHQVLVRADAFQQAGRTWRLTEVKSSTRVKPYHLLDCAVQTWIIREAGYPVEQTRLAHVDTRFSYAGDGDYAGLLKTVDVTENIEVLLPEVPGWIAQSFAALAGEQPTIDIGPQCTDPFACPFVDHCSPPLPEYPVTGLPNGGRIVDQLLAEGIDDVRDIPAGRLTQPLQERVRLATVSGEAFLDSALTESLRGLRYPRHYLDFETTQFVVPIWAGTHPYEQLPFQWSCHSEAADGTLQHHEFLDTSGGPPMRSCARALIATLGQAGPILTYSPFERTVINRLAARFPDLEEPLHALTERIVDLLPLVKAHYYHPDMRGSFSIKAVLPTVAPHLSYDGLGEVKDGISAQAAFEEAIDVGTATSRRQQLEQQLLAYCALDTLAMVELVKCLSRPEPREVGAT